MACAIKFYEKLVLHFSVLDWLDVDIDYQLHAQDHETMIAATRTKLGPTNQWWIVDVYVIEQAGRQIL